MFSYQKLWGTDSIANYTANNNGSKAIREELKCCKKTSKLFVLNSKNCKKFVITNVKKVSKML